MGLHCRLEKIDSLRDSVHWSFYGLFNVMVVELKSNIQQVLFYFSLTEEVEELGIPYLNLNMMAIIIGSGLLVHLLYYIYKRFIAKPSLDPEDPIDETDYLLPRTTNESQA